MKNHIDTTYIHTKNHIFTYIHTYKKQEKMKRKYQLHFSTKTSISNIWKLHNENKQDLETGKYREVLRKTQ